MIASIIAGVLIITAIVLAYIGKSSRKLTEVHKSFDLLERQEEFEKELLEILFEHPIYRTVIVEFNSYYVQYLVTEIKQGREFYCEIMSETYLRELNFSIDNIDLPYSETLGFSKNQDFVETVNFNKIYHPKKEGNQEEILSDLYFIMENVYKVSKSTLVLLKYF